MWNARTYFNNNHKQYRILSCLLLLFFIHSCFYFFGFFFCLSKSRQAKCWLSQNRKMKLCNNETSAMRTCEKYNIFRRSTIFFFFTFSMTSVTSADAVHWIFDLMNFDLTLFYFFVLWGLRMHDNMEKERNRQGISSNGSTNECHTWIFRQHLKRQRAKFSFQRRDMTKFIVQKSDDERNWKRTLNRMKRHTKQRINRTKTKKNWMRDEWGNDKNKVVAKNASSSFRNNVSFLRFFFLPRLFASLYFKLLSAHFWAASSSRSTIRFFFLFENIRWFVCRLFVWIRALKLILVFDLLFFFFLFPLKFFSLLSTLLFSFLHFNLVLFCSWWIFFFAFVSFFRCVSLHQFFFFV